MQNEEEYIPSMPIARIAYDLLKKGAKHRETKVHPGEFVFDWNGDVIGIYVGNGQIDIAENIK